MTLQIAARSVRTTDDRDLAFQRMPFGEVDYARIGDSGWKRTPQGVSDLSPDELADIKTTHSRELSMMFALPSAPRAQALGEEEIDGKKCAAVLIGEGAASATMLMDVGSGYPVALRYKGKGPQGAPVEIMDVYDDWRSAGSIMVPFNIEKRHNGELFGTMAIKSVALNGPVDEKLFARPGS